MLSLRSFHVVLIAVSIVLAAGCGVWALFNQQPALGVIALAIGAALVVYWAYFVTRGETTPLE